MRHLMNPEVKPSLRAIPRNNLESHNLFNRKHTPSVVLFNSLVPFISRMVDCLSVVRQKWSLGLVLYWSLSLNLASLALAGSITANVDQLNFENGEEIALSVEVDGSLDEELTFPASQDFKVSGTSKSTQVQIINGSYSKRNIYLFSLFPTKVGKLTIPSIEAKIDGVLQKTIPIPITVGGKQGGSPSTGGGSGSASSNQGSVGSPQSRAPSASDSNGLEMFIVERQVSPGPYFVHKPIVETIKVLRRVDWQAASKSVDNNSNWQVYEISGDQQSIENRQGVNYRVLTLKRVLVPLKAGSLAAPSWTLNVEFIDMNRRRSVNPFDFFSQAPLSKRLIAAPEVSLSVSGVPEADLPVGVLEPKVQLSQNSVNVGESVTMTFSVNGQGWFSGMGINPPVLNGNFKTYQDQPSTKEEVTANGLSGEKSIKISIIPHEPGELVFPPWKFRYFDTSLGKITEKIVTIPRIQVTGQKEDFVIAGSADSSPTQSKNSEFHPPDFYFGKSFGAPFGKIDRFIVLGFFSLATLLFLVMGCISFRRWQLKGKNPNYLHAIRSWQKLRVGIKRVRKDEEIVKLLHEYSASRMGSHEHSITYRDVTSVLASDGWQSGLLDNIRQFLVAVDARKYAAKDLNMSLPLDEIKKEVRRKKPCAQ